ncbi:MAG: hypothetical protein JWN04_6117 [Myxococcaceae bacterium]|nr:hypothetical protein [Myxococcaceae bacterium]
MLARSEGRRRLPVSRGVASTREVCSKARVLAVVLAVLAACQPDSSTCAENGGITVNGLCQCPPTTAQVGSRCLPSDASLADAAAPASDAASADAARDTGDAGVVESDADAGVQDAGKLDGALPAKGGDAAVADDGASAMSDAQVTCAPTGEWTITLSHHTGACTAAPAMFSATFNGKLSDALVNGPCPLVQYHLTPDGCTFTYTQDCAIGTDTTEREIGVIVMTSPTSANGVLNTTDFMGSDSTHPTCTSQTQLDAVKN